MNPTVDVSKIFNFFKIDYTVMTRCWYWIQLNVPDSFLLILIDYECSEICVTFDFDPELGWTCFKWRAIMSNENCYQVSFAVSD